jgi:hypothetical protein
MRIRLRCRRGIGVHWRTQVTEARHGDHPGALVIATTAAMNGQQREPDPASWCSIGPQRVVTNWLPCATRLLARLMSLSKRHPSSIVAATRSRPSHPCRIGSKTRHAVRCRRWRQALRTDAVCSKQRIHAQPPGEQNTEATPSTPPRNRIINTAMQQINRYILQEKYATLGLDLAPLAGGTERSSPNDLYNGGRS